MQMKKGISLIVLVITIIVMIILAAAVIISLQNSGIIDRASTAVQEHNLDEVNHIAQVAWSEAYLNGAKTQGEFEAAVTQALANNNVDTTKYDITVTTTGVTVALKQAANAGWVQDGLTITKGNVTLEAGDLIQYNAGVQGYSGAWKVLGAEDGKLHIMSTANVSFLKLYGLEGNGGSINYGLFNGIARLNEICGAYGNGTGAVGARSIKAEDVDKLTEFDKTTYRANQLDQYGNQVTYSWNNGELVYTSTNGKSGTSSNFGGYESSEFSYVDFNTMTKTTIAVGVQTGMPTITNDYYSYEVSDTTLPTRSQKATEMLLGPLETYDEYSYYVGEYWLASQSVCATEDVKGGVRFGLDAVLGGYINWRGLFDSDGNEWQEEQGVRAVVELSPNITIGTKDSTLGWSYTI